MTPTGILREKGITWAKNWFSSHGYSETKMYNGTFYGIRNKERFGIFVITRDHRIASKPYEAVTLQLKDVISIDKQFRSLNISRGFVLIARGFRESNRIRKDLPHFVKVPFPLLDRFILKRGHQQQPQQ